ncbi:hypothetical protein A2686_02850 [Candidatus Woesebacteria bacterium RIFCSPHIGHO2_01_FULL_38_10]|uniref:DDH domain-containing protein n=1 Tax=Candidatus Woesebacteria bacterium RIFCSPLOWO2_01_FULL_39_10b TaxID=1802517 RepID=A0A1F8BAW8_9BACT|nr:MAG: hypothetical protein A2686_02850 [Candidatus Woesebacteria bacterium RIFCSPHIGHO2_01_FULL_38_10]OGM60498.1 MAG: hypothetical protein A2892_00540 [Candidatus Woesebacteria bacterium RIFCSPLOWO2_01_FULL_39_10b]
METKGSKTLVTAKVNPDLDGVSCTLAYADLLKQEGTEINGVITGSPQSEVRYFIEKHNISIPTRPDENSTDWNKFILVDASSMKGMPKVVIPDRVVEIIDHRTGEPEREFPNARIQNEIIGAAATIIVERFIKVGKKINPDYAMLLYGAIYHNTLNFIATNTTGRDRKAVRYLETNYNLNEGVIREMFDFATREVEADVKTALEDDAKEFGEGWKIGAYQLVVWGSEIFSDKKLIEESVRNLKDKMGADWSFVNIIDLEARNSHIYSESDDGGEIISEALGAEFRNGWITLPAILRKQIMPKVNEVTDNENERFRSKA